MRNFRVEFKRPDAAGRMHKVFTFYLAEDEEQARKNVEKAHPKGTKVTKVEQEKRRGGQR